MKREETNGERDKKRDWGSVIREKREKRERE